MSSQSSCVNSVSTIKHHFNGLSDIVTLHHQKVSNIDQKLTLATPLPGASAEQRVLLNTVSQTAKRQVMTFKMADMFVPSPGLYNVTSPNSSIYDMDRSEQMVTCCVSSFSNPSDSIYTDEIGLDDKLEDSNIQNFLTPDVMSSFQSAPGINRINFWSDKMDSDVPDTELIDTLDTNPTLTQLNMEPEMSFVSDILNLDQDDSKMSYSLDFFCADINNGLGGQYNLSALPASSADSPSNLTHPAAGFSSFHKMEQKSLVNVGQEYVKSANQNKSSFPPRAQQPTIIGVVAPVKNNAEDNVTKSYSLHELLTKNRIKSESLNKLDSHNVSSCDKTAQIVPSSNPLKRTIGYLVKEEPLSPPAKVEMKDESNEEKMSDSVEEKTVVKDESTEDKWKDIQKFIHSPEMDTPPKKRRRYDSGSSSHISDDEDDDDDDDDKEDEFDDDDYSDIDADIAQISPKDCESLVATGKKQKQFFWQYNVQSKGPKGTRLKLAVESPADPHVLNDFEDPVFDECNTTIAGIRHGGKARKGDGNEITPNPKKLFMIGHQLMKLNRQINACQLGADVPTAKRNESRKEKNKLASRACRLKKKAQHEANKIKLYGLEQEHGQLNSVIHFIWPFIQERAKLIMEQSKMSLTSPSKSLTAMLEAAIAQSIKDRIAGNTTEYVNSIILKVENGEQNGGLTIKKNRKS